MSRIYHSHHLGKNINFDASRLSGIRAQKYQRALCALASAFPGENVQLINYNKRNELRLILASERGFNDRLNSAHLFQVFYFSVMFVRDKLYLSQVYPDDNEGMYKLVL